MKSQWLNQTWIHAPVAALSLSCFAVAHYSWLAAMLHGASRAT